MGKTSVTCKNWLAYLPGRPGTKHSGNGNLPNLKRLSDLTGVAPGYPGASFLGAYSPTPHFIFEIIKKRISKLDPKEREGPGETPGFFFFERKGDGKK